jgi:hypothetical protein
MAAYDYGPSNDMTCRVVLPRKLVTVHIQTPHPRQQEAVIAIAAGLARGRGASLPAVPRSLK